MNYQEAKIDFLVTNQIIEKVISDCWEKEKLDWVGFVPKLNKESSEYRDMIDLFHPTFFGLFGIKDIPTIETMDTTGIQLNEPYYFNDEGDLFSLYSMRSNLFYQKIFFEEFWDSKHWFDRVHLNAVEKILNKIKRPS